jgi:phosphonate transport system ATP-binding protein
VRLELAGIEARHPAARDGAPAALRRLDLRVAAGEQVAVIGPSGAGKTSLLQVAAASLKPRSGVVSLDGENPWELSGGALRRLRGRLFVAPQTPPLPPRQRVVTAVLAGRLPAIGLWESLRSLFYPTDIAGAYRALEHFDLADKLFERVDRLSGGERQRVGLARTLLAPASLWLIDEPLSALDPTRARQAINALLLAAEERGATVVATLHQVDTALAMFPRIVGLRDGRVAFDLPREAVDESRLRDLYAQHEGELGGPAPAADDAPAAKPVVMHCR